MRITIDATSALVRSAGVKSYTYHWLRHLRQQAAPGEEIRAFPLIEDWDSAGSRTFGAAARAHDCAGSPCCMPPTFWALRFWTSCLRGTDVFHAGNLVRKAPGRARLTATIHDLTSWIMPEVHTAIDRCAPTGPSRNAS